MTLRPPTGAEFDALSKELGFELSSDERRAFRGLVGGMLSTYEMLESEPEDLPAAPTGREYWWPTAAENPQNAWYVRTSIRSGEADFAGWRFQQHVVAGAGLELALGVVTHRPQYRQ